MKKAEAGVPPRPGTNVFSFRGITRPSNVLGFDGRATVGFGACHGIVELDVKAGGEFFDGIGRAHHALGTDVVLHLTGDDQDFLLRGRSFGGFFLGFLLGH